jgi:hypothetical protein
MGMTSPIRLLFLLAVLPLAACPRAATPTNGNGDGAATGPGEATQTQIDALEGIKEATKPPQQAVIFGTSDSGESTIIPLVGKDSTAVVNAMFVRYTGQWEGGSSPVWLTTSPRDDGRVRVGVYEQYAGGIGSQWRAGVWIASFVASSLLNKDLTDFKFSAESDGMVDGASASALMTAGFLATMMGDEILEDATMTGTINPDGTVGPVGGIPHKFLGSIELGKKRLGFPIGLTMDTDMNTYNMVDLKELAKEHGAEAVEIGDVFEAYTLMTGKTLPTPVPVEASEMEIDDAVMKQLEKHYDLWRTEIGEIWTQLLQLDRDGKLAPGIIEMATLANQEAEHAESLLSQGVSNAAYLRIISAWGYAITSILTHQLIEMVQSGDVSGAQTALIEIDGLATYTEDAMREVGALQPTTMGDHLLMVSSFQRAIAGWAYHDFGRTQLEASRTYLNQYYNYQPADLASIYVADDIARTVAPSILAIARAMAASKMGLEALTIEGVESLNYMCSLPNARKLAASYASAAAANLSYFESLFVTDISNALNVSWNSARDYMFRQAPDYLVAAMSFALPQINGLPQTLREEWGEKSLPWSLGTLAGSTLSYFKTSSLISKWYSLDVTNDYVTGRPTSVGREKAFISMVAAAERKAREHARAAKVATGSIPIQARLHSQNALEMFWESTVFSQTAVMLARNG